MAFIDIFNFKKYFSKPSDSQVARYGHVNALYDALSNSSAEKNYYDVSIKIYQDQDTSAITYNIVYNEIPSTFRPLVVDIVEDGFNEIVSISVQNDLSSVLQSVNYDNASVSTSQIPLIGGAFGVEVISIAQNVAQVVIAIRKYADVFNGPDRYLWINLRLYKDLM